MQRGCKCVYFVNCLDLKSVEPYHVFIVRSSIIESRVFVMCIVQLRVSQLDSQLLVIPSKPLGLTATSTGLLRTVKLTSGNQSGLPCWEML